MVGKMTVGSLECCSFRFLQAMCYLISFDLRVSKLDLLINLSDSQHSSALDMVISGVGACNR